MSCSLSEDTCASSHDPRGDASQVSLVDLIESSGSGQLECRFQGPTLDLRNQNPWAVGGGILECAPRLPFGSKALKCEEPLEQDPA